MTGRHRLSKSLILALLAVLPGGAAWSRAVTRDDAMRAAIHPVASNPAMQSWLARVPVTRDFPPDFADTLRGQGPAFMVEMSTAPGCIPCVDMWAKLSRIRAQYGLRVGVIGAQEAMIRSGRLGLPWVGHPVLWLHPVADQNRIVPIGVGTDHAPNLARNIYLATKMLTGVRVDVALRAMSKFTGIVGTSPSAVSRPSKN